MAIDVAKPMRRGVLLKTKKDAEPEWFDMQYEKLPFFCLSCGSMGHSELDCDKPVVHNPSGKLPYDFKLRAPEVKKKKMQSFPAAAADSFGSGSFARSKHSHGTMPRSEDHRSLDPRSGAEIEDDEEVMSPLKNPHAKANGGSVGNGSGSSGVAPVGRQLFQSQKGDSQIVLQKRKAKGSGYSPSLTPDLNVPAP